MDILSGQGRYVFLWTTCVQPTPYIFVTRTWPPLDTTYSGVHDIAFALCPSAKIIQSSPLRVLGFCFPLASGFSFKLLLLRGVNAFAVVTWL